MNRVLGYLKYTENYFLLWKIEGYSDTNWISGLDDIKPTNGYIFTLGGGPVPFKSPKQTCIAHSTVESEFIFLDKIVNKLNDSGISWKIFCVGLNHKHIYAYIVIVKL